MNSLTLDSDTAAGLDVATGDDVTLVMQATCTAPGKFDVKTVKETDASAYDENEAEAAPAESAMPESMGYIPGPVQRLMKKRK